MAGMYVKELAQIVGLSARRLYQINDELPEGKKLFQRKDGETKYDLAGFVRSWVEYREGLVRGAGEITLEEAKTRHELVKLEKTRYEVKKMQGEYVPVGDVIALGQEIASGVRNNLLHIPMTLAPVLAQMDDAQDIEVVLTQALRDALEDMSRLQNWQPEEKTPESQEDDEEENE